DPRWIPLRLINDDSVASASCPARYFAGSTSFVAVPRLAADAVHAFNQRRHMRITVIGAGYVGLVSAACLAEVGNDVCCIDVDEQKIACLRAGGVPIHERGLKELI